MKLMQLLVHVPVWVQKGQSFLDHVGQITNLRYFCNEDKKSTPGDSTAGTCLDGMSQVRYRLTGTFLSFYTLCRKLPFDNWYLIYSNIAGGRTL